VSDFVRRAILPSNESNFALKRERSLYQLGIENEVISLVDVRFEGV